MTPTATGRAPAGRREPAARTPCSRETGARPAPGRSDLLLAVAGHEAEQVLRDQQPMLVALTAALDSLRHPGAREITAA
ncbi:hypothetical protein [Sphaerisporangium perillae]|uniref:hypothetical protein n=1 Tax=Sphaerisporangium perillae TaxID=2935860 RepID=UPI00200E8611|nr:hypothetical protein [Sphaerisporangium perillae]